MARPQPSTVCRGSITSERPEMTRLPTGFGKLDVHAHWATWLLVAMTPFSIACSDGGSPTMSDPAASGSGGALGGAGGDAHTSPAGDAGESGASPSSGAAGSGVPGAGSGGEGAPGGATGMGGTAGRTETEDAGAGGAEDTFIPAPHPPFPLVVKHSGPVLDKVQLVPVYFGNDPLRADLDRFNSWIVTSDYWKQVGAEYGVHAGTLLPAVQMGSVTAASLDDTEIATWINARVADGTLPKPSPNTLFALFYQAGTKITSGPRRSCEQFGALHESVVLANPVYSGEIAFVIIPRCSYSPGDEFMIATDVTSHEYMEAATCPFPTTNGTWFMENYSGPLEAWWMLSGPAVADLCLGQSYDMIDGFAVNDIWSNAAAEAGNNPCQPSDPKHPFFSVSADETIYHALPGTTLSIH